MFDFDTAVLKIIFTDFEAIIGSGGELLELRLLEKTARHFFIIARHRSSK
jgi:hypothetical protein